MTSVFKGKDPEIAYEDYIRGKRSYMYCRLSSSVEDSISGARIIIFTCLAILLVQYDFGILRLIDGVLFHR